MNNIPLTTNKYDLNSIHLTEIGLGDACIVKSIEASGSLRRRFLDLGLIPGTMIKPLMISPSGDPIAYLIRGTVIAIRSDDAYKISVELI